MAPAIAHLLSPYMSASRTPFPERAFTLTELLVILAVLGVIAAILIPVIARIRGAAQSTRCVANLQQLGHAFALHAQDNRGCLPAPIGTQAGGTPWYAAIHRYTGTPWAGDIQNLGAVFRCPTWEADDTQQLAIDSIGYSMSCVLGPGFAPTRPVDAHTIPNPSRTIVLLERAGPASFRFPTTAEDRASFAADYTTRFGEQGCDRHGTTANYLFADGHVGRHDPDSAAALLQPSPAP